MSALNCFVLPNAVHVFTDGGHYDFQSVDVCGIGNKLAFLPEYNAVIGAVGYAAMPLLMASFLADRRFDSLRSLAAQMPNLARGGIAKLASMGGPSSWGKFEMILAGWDGEPIAHHLFGTVEDTALHYQEVTRFRSPDHPDFEGFDFDPAMPASSGLRLMVEQRNKKFAVPTANPKPADAMRNLLACDEDRTDAYRVVHGFCQHTIVTRDGITTKVLERWPDEVGKRISAVDVARTS